MNDIIKNIEATQLKESVPEFHVGDTVKVYNKIKEGNRERIQVFEGTVLKRQNGGARETFTVRKNSNGIGVEKTWGRGRFNNALFLPYPGRRDVCRCMIEQTGW